MVIKQLRKLLASDYEQCNQLIEKQLQSDIDLIVDLGHHLFDHGGKRIRPLLVLLSANALNYKGNEHIDIAVAVEFFHASTLLHDDVVDESNLRRGQSSANAIWGDKASILVGDYLFTNSFQLCLATKRIEILQTLADAALQITTGEVQQLVHSHQLDMTEAQYIDVINKKTAALFEAAAKMGPILMRSDDSLVNAMGDYGLHLGNAFQLVDDTLDYDASADKLGKNIGDDLAEGKLTLPLIYALKNGSADQQTIIRKAIENKSIDDLAVIQEIIQDTQAIQYTHQMAKSEVNKAISSLETIPSSKYRDGLIQLAEFSIAREF